MRGDDQQARHLFSYLSQCLSSASRSRSRWMRAVTVQARNGIAKVYGAVLTGRARWR